MSAFSVLSFLDLAVAGRLHVPVRIRAGALHAVSLRIYQAGAGWVEVTSRNVYYCLGREKGKCVDLAGRPKYKKG